jgi:two-component system, chemotaxis family, sensor kinase CheA
MADVEIAQQVEELSEALVLVDTGDLQALAGIHGMLERVGAWASDASTPPVKQAVASATALVEQIIFGEAVEGGDSLALVGRTVSAVQSIVRDGRDPDEVVFPQELMGDDATTGAPGQGAEALLPLFALPAHIDEKIFGDFLARQPGILGDIEELILALEKSDDEEKLGELRRYLHTLKGEAGMLGLADAERLCHTTEEILGDGPAKGHTDILLEACDWLGRAFAFYSGQGEAPETAAALMGRMTGTDPVVEEQGVAEDVPAAKEPTVLGGDLELLGEFVNEANEHLDNADVHLLTIETDPQDAEALNAVFRAFHTIKGVAGFLALDDVLALSHEAENLLDRARKHDLVLEGGCIDVTFDAVDMLKRLIAHVAEALASRGVLEAEASLHDLIARIRAAISGEDIKAAPVPPVDPGQKLGEVLVEKGVASETAVADALHQQQLDMSCEKLGELLLSENILTRSQLDSALKEQAARSGDVKLGELLLELGLVTKEDLGRELEKQEKGPAKPPVGELLVKSGAAAPKDVAQALRGQKQQRAVEVRETVKVESDRLDRMIDLIGEMVIAESMVSQSPELAEHLSSDMTRHLNQLDKITRELQEMGTSLRMVPVRGTFQKMARLVRDVAKKAGKNVGFSMRGEDTELDKSVVDKIGDPLVHMVRNSVDHGIEKTAEERIAAGKSPAGTVELRAFHKGGSILIEIEDDGKGLDREAILAKARERGIVREGETPTDSEVWKLIFEAGFSTAKEVTDVSGRGVGMDVVRRNIDSLRGQIDIKSEKGKGSVFSIRLPLTLAIIDGMVIRAGEERYILPTLSVVRSIQPQADDLLTVVEQGEVLSLQGELIPMFRLHRLFDLHEAQEDPSKALVVIVEDGGKRAGIMVDELLGQQQIVIKSLGETMRGLQGVSGGAIMSDGRVGIILDVGGLVRMADARDGHPAVQKVS